MNVIRDEESTRGEAKERLGASVYPEPQQIDYALYLVLITVK